MKLWHSLWLCVIGISPPACCFAHTSPSLATAWHHVWKVKTIWVVQPEGLAGSTDFHQDNMDPISRLPNVIRCFEPRIVYLFRKGWRACGPHLKSGCDSLTSLQSSLAWVRPRSLSWGEKPRAQENTLSSHWKNPPKLVHWSNSQDPRLWLSIGAKRIPWGSQTSSRAPELWLPSWDRNGSCISVPWRLRRGYGGWWRVFKPWIPNKTMVVSILKWSNVGWFWGTPHDFGNLHIIYIRLNPERFRKTQYSSWCGFQNMCKLRRPRSDRSKPSVKLWVLWEP